jgi:hypothetical protein
MKKENVVINQNNQLPSYIKKGEVLRGAENVTKEDLVIPRLELVQALSPCRKKTDPNYIEGIEEGMMYNNVTRKVYGNSVIIVPVFYTKEYLLWKDRKKGGGFAGAFPTVAKAEEYRSSLQDDGDYAILDTAQHFCLLVDGDNIEEIMLSLSKSKMKVSRILNSLVRLSEVDSFAKMYELSSVVATNQGGEEFWNYKISNGSFVSEKVYKRAEELYTLIKEGNVKASHEYDVSSFEENTSEETEY